MAYQKLNGAQLPIAQILAAANGATLAMHDDGVTHWSNTNTIRFVLPGVMAG